MIQTEEAEKVLNTVRYWMKKYSIKPVDEQKMTGDIRHIFIRTNKYGQILVCIVSTKNKLTYSNELVNLLKAENLDLAGLVLNTNNKKNNVILGDKYKTYYGKDWIIDELFDYKFKLSVPSFFQVNI